MRALFVFLGRSDVFWRQDGPGDPLALQGLQETDVFDVRAIPCREEGLAAYGSVIGARVAFELRVCCHGLDVPVCACRGGLTGRGGRWSLLLGAAAGGLRGRGRFILFLVGTWGRIGGCEGGRTAAATRRGRLGW